MSFEVTVKPLYTGLQGPKMAWLSVCTLWKMSYKYDHTT